MDAMVKTTMPPAIRRQNIYVRGVWLDDEARVSVVRRTNSKNKKKNRVFVQNYGVCPSLEEFEAVCALAQLARSHPDFHTAVFLSRRESLWMLKHLLWGSGKVQATEPLVEQAVELAASRARQLASYLTLSDQYEQHISVDRDRAMEDALRGAPRTDCVRLTTWLHNALVQQWGMTTLITNRPCVCGKVVFSEDEARQVVTGARVQRALHDLRGRREDGSYPCVKAPGIWHVTSLKGSS